MRKMLEKLYYIEATRGKIRFNFCEGGLPIGGCYPARTRVEFRRELRDFLKGHEEAYSARYFPITKSIYFSGRRPHMKNPLAREHF